MSDFTLFEYAVVLQPRKGKEGENDKPELLVAPSTVLVKDSAHAQTIAARAIPEEHIDNLERITVVVRPF